MELDREERTTFRIYDDFDRPDYSLSDYAQKWSTPYGLGEMEKNDTRDFAGGCLNMSAVPFQTAADLSVSDHIKYMAFSTETFQVPKDGALVLSADVKASTTGTVPELMQRGVYGDSGAWRDPASPPTPLAYSAPLLEGQQAAVVVNVFDLCTGVVLDWFVTSHTAFPLYERLPSTVTSNVNNPDCANATEVGIDKIYTQIVREIPIDADAWHHIDIALSRHDGEASVDYFFDHQPVAHVANIGVPLDKQGASFSGTYASLGPGERLGDRLDSVRFGHGFFSLLDAFPFQHPGAPEKSVSIPVANPPSPALAGRARLFGQGARGSFDNFTTLTLQGHRDADLVAILNAIADAHPANSRAPATARNGRNIGASPSAETGK
jgi:Family of unknown function (DUF6081)